MSIICTPQQLPLSPQSGTVFEGRSDSLTRLRLEQQSHSFSLVVVTPAIELDLEAVTSMLLIESLVARVTRVLANAIAPAEPVLEWVALAPALVALYRAALCCRSPCCCSRPLPVLIIELLAALGGTLATIGSLLGDALRERGRRHQHSFDVRVDGTRRGSISGLELNSDVRLVALNEASRSSFNLSSALSPGTEPILGTLSLAACAALERLFVPCLVSALCFLTLYLRRHFTLLATCASTGSSEQKRHQSSSSSCSHFASLLLGLIVCAHIFCALVEPAWFTLTHLHQNYPSTHEISRGASSASGTQSSETSVTRSARMPSALHALELLFVLWTGAVGVWFCWRVMRLPRRPKTPNSSPVRCCGITFHPKPAHPKQKSVSISMAATPNTPTVAGSAPAIRYECETSVSLENDFDQLVVCMSPTSTAVRLELAAECASSDVGAEIARRQKFAYSSQRTASLVAGNGMKQLLAVPPGKRHSTSGPSNVTFGTGLRSNNFNKQSSDPDVTSLSITLSPSASPRPSPEMPNRVVSTNL